MVKGAVIITGNELLEGVRQDANSKPIASLLQQSGVNVTGIYFTPDETTQMAGRIREAGKHNHIVVICGGLGPTKDDVTRKALEEVFPARKNFNKKVYNRIHEVLKKKNTEVTENNYALAYIPENAKVIPNGTGTAPGLHYKTRECDIIALPGVPDEARQMMVDFVMPLLAGNGNSEFCLMKTIRTAGLRESYLGKLLNGLEQQIPPHMTIAYLPDLAEVSLKITARGDNKSALNKEIHNVCRKIENLAGKHVYGYDLETIAGATGQILKKYGKTMSVAESCTGGYISHLITSEPGCSSWYDGGIVAYSNEMKHKFLSVERYIIEKFGAVSKNTVEAMVKGAVQNTESDFAVATSGIAGPGGGTAEKPPGTIWIAAGNTVNCKSSLLHLSYDRSQNIRYTAVAAINLLRELLSGIKLEQPK